MIHESKLYGDQFCLPKTTEYKYDPVIVKQFFAQEHLALTHRQQKMCISHSDTKRTLFPRNRMLTEVDDPNLGNEQDTLTPENLFPG